MMALCKKIVDEETGIELGYWKVCDLEIDWLNKMAKATLKGWVNKKARDSGKRPLKSYLFIWSKNDFDFDPDKPILEQVYNKIKSRVYYSDVEKVFVYADFTDAKDC